MDRKIKYDPNKVSFDGRTFKVVVKDKDAFRKKMQKIREEIINDLTSKTDEDDKP